MQLPITFHEKQGFRQWWLWLTIVGLDGLFLYLCVMQLGFGIKMGNNPAPDGALLAFSTIPLLITFLILSWRLETEITDEGISFRVFPFLSKKRTIPWSEMQQCFVRKYNPVLEYGGWGIKGLLGRGIAYNTSGNMGIQIMKTDGKHILIGTLKPDEARLAIKAFGRM